jgi:decaprenylphospho-beta-D-ribofuranose 2-oxidase
VFRKGASRFHIPVHLPSWIMHPFSVSAFNTLYSVFPRRERDRSFLERFMFPLDAVGDWNRVYGKRGFIQYQMVVPHASARRVIKEMFERVNKSGQTAALATIKHFGRRGDGLLSFPMDGLTLALDLPVRPGLEELTSALDSIVIDAGGRVYLAKDALLTPESFRKMYPRADSFLAVKRRLDPDGVIASSLSRRLGLTHA